MGSLASDTSLESLANPLQINGRGPMGAVAGRSSAGVSLRCSEPAAPNGCAPLRSRLLPRSATQ